MAYKLILLRHGQSAWNKANLFTGWVDVPLSDKGVEEAKYAGHLLKKENILPNFLFTSRLTRAITTANIVLEIMNRSWIDVARSWRLNERHYGNLQGKNKAQILAKYGINQFTIWRRSYDISPPAITKDNEFSQFEDSRYIDINKKDIPATESLKDVLNRFLPYWENIISKKLIERDVVMIVAHGNSIRAIIKHLDNISDKEIANINIPTGIPLIYEIDENLKPLKKSFYLDPEAAKDAMNDVRDQGNK